MRIFQCILFILSMFFTASLLLSNSSFDITNYGTSAKSMSLGHIEGFAQLPTNVFENPAGLTDIDRLSISNFYSSTLSDEVQFINFAVAMPFFDGFLGFGWMQSQTHDLLHTSLDEHEYITIKERFSYRDQVFKLGYAFMLSPKLDFGTALSLFNFQMGPFVSGKGYNMDVSLNYYWNANLQSILVIQNIIPVLQMNYDNHESLSLPFKMKFMNKYSLSSFNLYSQFQFRKSINKFEYAFGMDYTLPWLAFLNLSAGFREYTPLNDTRHGYNLGLGLRLIDFNFDFCYEKSDFIIDPHQYSMSFGFHL